MSFDVFLNFDGDCRQAIDFYAGVFKAEPSRLMNDHPRRKPYLLCFGKILW
jgi:uncharacterized glyoxalase superfamily protein PhnB